jgi:hypothetical protein
VSAPAPTPAPTPLPDGYWQKRVNFGTDGSLTIQGGNEPYKGEYCYFVNGPHPQKLLFEGTTKVAANHSRSYAVPDLASMLENDTCEPIKVGIQSDAGAFTFDCSNPSNQLADAGTDHLHAYKYFDVDVPAGREPGEWKTVDEGEWGECPEVEVNGSIVKPETCYECRTITVSNGCEERQKLDKREVECSCTPEWVPGEWESQCRPWSECSVETPQDSIFSTSNEVSYCPGTQSAQCVRTRTWTNQCNDRTREEKERYVDTQDCQAPCPPEDGYCHISNKGGRDNQINIVITGNGHSQHADPTKFCPPDLLSEACSCDAAIAASIQCGFPADGNFICKDNR